MVTQQGGYLPLVAVILVALWITGGALSKSLLIGRLADPMTHNDVNYVIDGIRRLLYFEINGFWAELAHLFWEPMHAPLLGYQAALGFYLFGFHDWAPYVSDIIYVLIFLGVCVSLLRGTPNMVVIAGITAMAGMPLAYTTISEFSPEISLGLFTAVGVLLTLRIRLFDRALGPRALAGLCFGLGFIAKPSSFAFVPLVVCATLGVILIRDVLLAGKLRIFQQSLYFGALHLLLALWLPALYIIPNFSEFTSYFQRVLLDKKTVEAFAGNHNFKQHLLFYLTGEGSEYMFGNFLWAYVGTIAVGVAAAAKREDRLFIARQLEMSVLVIFMWLLPTFAIAKGPLWGMPFGFLLAFMVVMSLRSIYEMIGGVTGVIATSALSLFLLVSGTSSSHLSNTPEFDWYEPTGEHLVEYGGAHIVREKWPEAMDRFRAVILGNTAEYRGRSVYLTAVGYYDVPLLEYWFLKTDPSLDWKFSSLWIESDPRSHLDYIHQNQSDFVIAGEHDNGLTYGRVLVAGAAASEDTVLAALWNDPNYMPIDQFYGPTGRTITVFQRCPAYAGWRLLAGLKKEGGTKRPWLSRGTITHLQAYAANAVAGELVIDANGPPDQTIEIVVNHDPIGHLTFDSAGQASLTQPIDLVLGQNDIVFRYSSNAPATFKRLLVTRKIERLQ
jgi:hypothetical protein